MYTDCEGIILRQTKITGGRRILVVLTDKFGKISAGTSIAEKGKNKTSLALRPFTKGHYELYKNADNFNINGAETLESFYAIGEDVDKYLAASYVLEFTDKAIQEGDPCEGAYMLLCDFLGLLTRRKSSFTTLVIAYQIKTLAAFGLSVLQNPLLAEQSNDIIKVVEYIEGHSMVSLEELALSEGIESTLSEFLKQYISYHLGISDLKSEGLRM